MVLPTSVERGWRCGAAVDLCADELWTHGCALPDGVALASRRARVAASKCQNGKWGDAERPFWRLFRSGDLS